MNANKNQKTYESAQHETKNNRECEHAHANETANAHDTAYALRENEQDPAQQYET